MKQRRSQKKRIIIVILCAGLLLMGSGYGFALKNIRLITTETDPVSVKWMKNMTAEYTKQHPDVRISLEFVGLVDMYPKLMSAVAVNDIPEIIGTDTMLTISLAYRGLLEPVTDIINKTGREDYIFPGLVTYEGEDYSVPYGIACKIMWYREDLFKQKGLSIPQTREELLECARTLTEDLNGDGEIDRYGLALALSRKEANAEWTLIQIWIGGGHVFNVWNEVVLDKAPYFRRNVKTVEFIRELAKYTPPGLSLIHI